MERRSVTASNRTATGMDSPSRISIRSCQEADHERVLGRALRPLRSPRSPGTPDWPPAAGPLRIGDQDGMDLHRVFVRLEPVYREGAGGRAHPEPGRFPVRGPSRQYRREAGRGFVILEDRVADAPVASGHPARGRRREIPTSSSGVIRSRLPMP